MCGPTDIIAPIADVDEQLKLESGGRGAQNHQSPPLPHAAGAHMTALRVKRAIGQRTWRDYYKFSAERNPWDAVVSLYYWHYKDPEVRVAFEEFLAGPRIHSLARANANNYRIRGEVVTDTLLRFEHLADDLDDVWTRLELPGRPELPHTKGGTRPATAARYRDLYTSATAALVGDVFADVIALLGYEF